MLDFAHFSDQWEFKRSPRTSRIGNAVRTAFSLNTLGRLELTHNRRLQPSDEEIPTISLCLSRYKVKGNLFYRSLLLFTGAIVKFKQEGGRATACLVERKREKDRAARL
jgi:hypothetical protein